MPTVPHNQWLKEANCHKSIEYIHITEHSLHCTGGLPGGEQHFSNTWSVACTQRGEDRFLLPVDLHEIYSACFPLHREVCTYEEGNVFYSVGTHFTTQLSSKLLATVGSMPSKSPCWHVASLSVIYTGEYIYSVCTMSTCMITSNKSLDTITAWRCL